MNRFQAAMLAQRGHLFAWSPVCLALGIGLYFALPHEPAQTHLWAAAGAAALLALMSRLGRGPVLPVLVLGCALTLAGFALAGYRANAVGGPVLNFRYYGPIEGRIVGVDRSASDAVRLTLDRVALQNVDPDRIPRRVRISLHGEQYGFVPMPGLRVMATGHLSAANGPVEPGGFDFQLHAWFLSLGAVGYTRVPVMVAAEPEGGLWVFGLRMAMTKRILEVLPGDLGGVAASLTTGDRSGISTSTTEDLRRSNLAHLLSISGMHMGILAAFVFGVLRYGMAAVPWLGLRVNSKKVAAAITLAVAAFYLAISGGNVATERAYVMVAVMLVSVLMDRRALSLRSVALAALIVLTLRPEALVGPGFQMSFAATVALVVVFRGMKGITLGPSWAQGAVSLFLSSLVAGLATAPFGAAHFNFVSHYGLLANLASVPLMGVLIMPAAVLAACLAPLGLEEIGLWLMGAGIAWIMWVARMAADAPGSVSYILSPGSAVLPLISLGGCLAILWQGRARYLGVAVVLLAGALWTRADRPPLLVADTGAIVGLMTEQGRALSRPRGAGFIAETWLENDGDGTIQEDAAARWTWAGDGRLAVAPLGQGRVIHASGKKAAEALQDCAPQDVIVASVDIRRDLPCQVFDPRRLRDTGSLAITPDGDGLRIVTARDRSGWRLWNSPQGPSRP